MKDKKARSLIDWVETYAMKLDHRLIEKTAEIEKQAKQIESLTDKIESINKTLDSFGFRSCPKCKRGTMTIKYHYMRPFDVKEDGTLYKRPEYECLVCGTKYDLKEQPVIKED